MTTLLIVCAEPSSARLRTALSIALTHAALGGDPRLFLDTLAVGALCSPIAADDDRAHEAAGLPALAGLVEEAFAAGIGITACQTGLAMLGATAAEFDPRIDFGGLPVVMAQLGPDDRLLVV